MRSTCFVTHEELYYLFKIRIVKTRTCGAVIIGEGGRNSIFVNERRASLHYTSCKYRMVKYWFLVKYSTRLHRCVIVMWMVVLDSHGAVNYINHGNCFFPYTRQINCLYHLGHVAARLILRVLFVSIFRYAAALVSCRHVIIMCACFNVILISISSPLPCHCVYNTGQVDQRARG